MARSHTVRWSLIGAMAVLFLLHLHFITLAGRTSDPTDQHNLVVIPLIGAVFCLINAIFLLGWKRALRLLALSVVIGWIAEQVGVATGLIFGDYHYTAALGPKLLDVPAVIPLFWFMLIYLGYVIANLMTLDTPDDPGTGDLMHELWVAFLGALIATAYDLGLDPYMASGEVSAWVWDPPPPANLSYFGVPVQNFFGWIAVAFVILFIARRLDHHRRKRGEVPPNHLAHFRPAVAKALALVPVLFYFSFWLQHLSHNYSPPVVVISLVSLGIPAMAAVSNWRRWRVGQAPRPTS
jgi:putative membrane protein